MWHIPTLAAEPEEEEAAAAVVAAIKQLTAHWTLVSPLRWAAGTANVGVAATRCMRRQRRRRASTHTCKM